ncbi:GvpL/GvpF family gas vesicle protein [Salipiger marinus]|nr:GvpL/GvpF family gas vesicle protein [Salipiger manganoxidans]
MGEASMTPLCLHGVIFPADTPAEAPPHRQVPLGPVSALVSDLTTPPGEPDGLHAVLAHDLLLGLYLMTGPVLPVRLGTCFSDGAALQAAITPQLPNLELKLRKMSGLAEYALVVEEAPLTPVQPLPQPANGRDFLRARKQLRDTRSFEAEARATDLRHLRSHASAVAKDCDLRPVMAPRLLSLSLLMDPVAATLLQTSLPDWSAASRMSARLTGPFPPYSFANLPMEDMTDA